MKAYNRYHPLTVFIYFMSIIIITMFINNPIMLGISLGGALIYYGILSGTRQMLRSCLICVPIITLLAVTNPLLSYNGKTVLFSVANIDISLESVLYGANTGVMMSSMIIWFLIYSIVLDNEKFIYLFGNIVPRIAMVLSMTFRLIPLYKREYVKIKDAQKTLGYYNKGFLRRVRNMLRIFLCLVSWALENSIDTSVSMKSRGYGIKGRTHYSRYVFKVTDVIGIAAIIVLDVFILRYIHAGYSGIEFYPVISYDVNIYESIWMYICFGLLVCIPSVIEFKENVKWKYCVSRI